MLRVGLPIDGEIAAFMAARSDMALTAELARINEAPDAAAAALVALRLLVWMQERQRIPALRNLAVWLGGAVMPLMAQWRNRTLRARLTAQMETEIKAGAMPRMLDLLDDHEAQEHDTGEAADAARLVARIDAELAELARAAAGRAALSDSVGHELALGAGMTALTLSLIATLVM